MFKTVELSAKSSTQDTIISEVKDSKKIALILLIAVGVLIPAVAILHAVDTSGSTNTTGDHDSDHNDHDTNHGQDHDDNETSDDNSLAHAEHDDLNDNETESD